MDFLVTKHLYRELMPLLMTHFLQFKEKNEGFVNELQRLNVLDETEMRRLSHSFFFPRIPTLVWLIEWTLTYAMRKVFDVYGWHEPFPYVIIDPYLFLGQLFQVIAAQWLILIQSNSSKQDMNVHELDKFLKTCMQEHLDRWVPIVPHNVVRRTKQQHEDWHKKMHQLHTRLWINFPFLREYIGYHQEWFKKFEQGDSLLLPSSNASTSTVSTEALNKSIKLLTKTVADLIEQLQASNRNKKQSQPRTSSPTPPPPHPAPARPSTPRPLPPAAAPIPPKQHQEAKLPAAAAAPAAASVATPKEQLPTKEKLEKSTRATQEKSSRRAGYNSPSSSSSSSSDSDSERAQPKTGGGQTISMSRQDNEDDDDSDPEFGGGGGDDDNHKQSNNSSDSSDAD